MDYKNLFRTVEAVHESSGKNRAFLFFNVVWCGLRYGAGYKDYQLCEFYNLNGAQRKTYVTRGINNTITRLMNDSSYYHIFDEKKEFYENFSQFIGREWIYLPETTPEEFARFMENREEIVIKPSAGSCGQGVERVKKACFANLEEMYRYVSRAPEMIAEDVIRQHEKINAITPDSVNTLRIVTISVREAPMWCMPLFGSATAERSIISTREVCAPPSIWKPA